MKMAKTILVIEDDEVQRELMSMTLKKRGYQVLTAENGVYGYDQALDSPPDLIVTDINMPGADGLHVVRRVRDTPELAATRILVTTGYGSGMAAFSLAEGADGYEPKPLNPESLVASVERLLS
jgi:two-component system cell cycle response regulator DivK